MDFGVIVAIAIVVLVAVVFLVYHFGFASPNAHSIVYGGIAVFSSPNAIANTSDGVSLIYYAAPDGVFSYNTSTKQTVQVSSLRAVGLAYGSGLLVNLANGDLYDFSVSESVPVAQNVHSLFSTTDGISVGYAYTDANGLAYNVSKTPANGDYVTLRYTVA